MAIDARSPRGGSLDRVYDRLDHLVARKRFDDPSEEKLNPDPDEQQTHDARQHRHPGHTQVRHNPHGRAQYQPTRKCH